MLNLMSFALPNELESALETAIETWRTRTKIARIWAKDAAVWTGADESKWLGWLSVIDEELADADRYAALSAEVQSSGFEHVLLMGMGGSSLAPEVLARTFGRDSFGILDSTVPAQIKSVEASLDLGNTLFIVASKSGSTLEPNCFKQYFYERVSHMAPTQNPGRQFIAITDPGSKMDHVAKRDGFRHVFYGKPEIGGRFSALSAFGMTAAAAMGLNVEELLNFSAEMSAACRNEDPAGNPGALLGLILGVCHRYGRDKLTIFTSPELAHLGSWLEQLIAESTGKNGVAIIPVEGEPILPADQYCEDRIFVSFDLKGSAPEEEFSIGLNALEAAEYPVIRIQVDGIERLGQEFFRWEFATAVAGAVMAINPFDQPDVEAAKVAARKLTEEYERTGSLPAESPFFEADRIQLFSSEAYANELRDLADEESLAGFLEAHLWNLEDNDYFALLAYLEMNAVNRGILQEIREAVLHQNGNATCLGFGPRFLHSTGQAYKGGPNTGVFLQFTSEDEADLPVPEQKFTFGVVKSAQARGDFQVLLDRGRRALRAHITGKIEEGLSRIRDAIS